MITLTESWEWFERRMAGHPIAAQEAWDALEVLPLATVSPPLLLEGPR